MGRRTKTNENANYEINKYTLFFTDSSVEKEFRERDFAGKDLRFKVQSMIAALASGISCIAVISVGSLELLAIPVVLLAHSFASLLVLFLKRGPFFKYFSSVCLAGNLMVSILTVEHFFAIALHLFLPITNILLVLGACLILDSMYMRVSLWCFYLINIATLQIYLTIRTSVYAVRHAQPQLVTIAVLVNFVYIMAKSAEFFLSEKQQRAAFIQNKVLISKLRMWRFVLDEVYPQSTFLVDAEDFIQKKGNKLSGHSGGILKKLSTNFFDKVLSKKPESKKKKQSDHAPCNSQGSFYLDYSPTRMKKKQLHVRTVEEMYDFLQNIEVMSTIHHNESNELCNPDGQFKNIHDIIQNLFHSSPEKATNLTFVLEEKSQETNFTSKDVDSKKEFSIKYLQQRQKRTEMKSVLVKGFYNYQVPGEAPSRIAINLKLSKFLWERKTWVMILFQDISDHEEIKTLKELDRLKDKLLASVTHDLRTPLNTVIVMIDNARSALSKKALNECLDFAEINAKLLSNLICDILDYSLFKENKMRMVYTNFLLTDLVGEISKLISFQLGQKNITFQLRNRCSGKQHLFSDSQRIKQILINLLTNSIKFTSRGSVKLTAEDFEEYNTVKFTVKDTGTGIKEENTRTLFQPFETFDTENGLNKQGIGLGLYICKNIVAQLGPFNQLFLNTVWGRGTKVEFYIFKDIRFAQDKYRQGAVASLSQSGSQKQAQGDSKLNNSRGSANNSSNRQQKSSNNFENAMKQTINLVPLEMKGKESESIDYSKLLNERSEFSSGLSLEDFKGKGEELMDPTHPIMEASAKMKGSGMNGKNPFTSEKSISEVIPSKEEALVLPPLRSNLNVLIVDDNVFNIFILENYLKKIETYHINTSRAYTGLEALEQFRAQNKSCPQSPSAAAGIDLIFMDCEMPTMNGYDASTAIKHLIKTENYRQCMIAACTSYQGKAEEEKCIASGMDFFLVKPVSQEEVLNLMKSISF